MVLYDDGRELTRGGKGRRFSVRVDRVFLVLVGAIQGVLKIGNSPSPSVSIEEVSIVMC